MPLGFVLKRGVEDAIGRRRIEPRAGILDRHEHPTRFDRFRGSTFGRSMTVLIASTPFVIRFSSTCCSWTRSPRTGRSSADGRCEAQRSFEWLGQTAD